MKGSSKTSAAANTRRWGYAIRLLITLSFISPWFSSAAGAEPQVDPSVWFHGQAGGTVPILIFLDKNPFPAIAAQVAETHASAIDTSEEHIRQLLAGIPGGPRALVATAEEESQLALSGTGALTHADRKGVRNAQRALKQLLQAQRADTFQRVHAQVATMQEEVRAYVEALGGQVTGYFTILNSVAASIPASNLSSLSGVPHARRVEYDWPAEGEITVVKSGVADPELTVSVSSIGAEAWWNAGFDGGDWDFSSLDSGIDCTHPDLTSHPCFPSSGPDDTSVVGHGTHVAGIAMSTNATFRGVSFGADAIIRCLSTSISTAMGCIESNLHGSSSGGFTAEVINVSQGFPKLTPATDDDNSFVQFIDGAIDFHRVLIIKSAGNLGPDWGTITNPGQTYNGIVVGNMVDQGTTARSDDVIANDSSRGPTPGGRRKPDLTAPGTDITSTNAFWEGSSNPDFVTLSGTSMAAPHVAGATLLFRDAGISDPRAIKAVLINSAQDQVNAGDPQGWDPDYGWGYLNLAHAFVHRNDFFIDSVTPRSASCTTCFRLYRGPAFTNDRATLVWHRRVNHSSGSPSALSDLDLNTTVSQTSESRMNAGRRRRA